jgi:hypothetical protein
LYATEKKVSSNMGKTGETNGRRLPQSDTGRHPGLFTACDPEGKIRHYESKFSAITRPATGSNEGIFLRAGSLNMRRKGVGVGQKKVSSFGFRVDPGSGSGAGAGIHVVANFSLRSRSAG